MTLLDVIRTAALEHGDKPAVIDSAGLEYTYAGFVEAIEAGAGWFRARAPRPPVLLVPGNGPDDVVAMYAAISAGCVPLIADKTWTREEIVRIAAVTGTRYVVASESSALRPESPEPTPWPTLWWTDLGPAKENDRLDGIGFGRFTSGTTGMSRCLGFAQTAAVNAAKAWRGGAGLTADDVVLCLATLNNGLAFNTSLLAVFSAGATLALHAGRPIPSSVARSIRTFRPTVLTAFPFAFEALTKAGADVGSNLRLAVSSAAPLSPQTAQDWRDLAGIPICDYYGLAEVGPVTFNDGTVSGSMGLPLEGVELAVEEVAETPDGAEGGGRVLVRTPAMASRYIDDLEPDLAASMNPAGFLRTKDLGRLDVQGRLFLTGRLGQVVNVAGRKIDPTEVAGVIRQLTGVRDVVVRGEKSNGGEVLAAYVESTTVDRGGVVDHCRRNLSVYKLPQRISILDRFPRTSTGKVNATALTGTGRQEK